MNKDYLKSDELKLKIQKFTKEEALLMSIAKWIMIKHGLDYDDQDQNCALCLKAHNGCHKCIIFKEVGEHMCLGTPYIAWNNHQWFKHKDKPYNSVYCEVCKRLANDELKFLINIYKKYYGGK